MDAFVVQYSFTDNHGCPRIFLVKITHHSNLYNCTATEESKTESERLLCQKTLRLPMLPMHAAVIPFMRLEFMLNCTGYTMIKTSHR